MVFAQELSEDFAISSFHPFDPDHYNSIPFFPAPIPREVGQLGLMGYISREGEVVFDNADRLRTTLRNKLAHGDSSLEGAAFFSLEARCFVNDATRVVSALENISLTIRGTENRTAWKTITEAAIQYSQTTSSNRARAKKSDQSSAAIESDHSIDFQNYQSAEWPREWRREWNRAIRVHPTPKERLQQLANIAKPWLERQEIDSSSVLSVLLPVLNYTFDIRLQRRAIEWLEQEHFDSQYWGKLWPLVSHQLSDRTLATALRKTGIRFLESTLEATTPTAIDTWSTVWRVLRNPKELRPHLIQLAEAACANFGEKPQFVRSVLSYITDETFARDHVLDWLKRFPKGTNAWAASYSRFVGTNGIDDEIVSIGFMWLRTYANLNGWKRVWSALFATGFHRTLLVDLARNWLERSYPDLKAWPMVMAAVIAGGAATEVEVDLAKRWLASHRRLEKTAHYQDLYTLVHALGSSDIRQFSILNMHALLDKELRSFANGHDLRIKKKVAFGEVVEELRKKELLPASVLSTIEQLAEIRNAIAHPKERPTVRSEDLMKYSNLLDSVIMALQNYRAPLAQSR